MPINYDVYKEKALEAVREVFVKEYKNSIGIPLPEIDFVLPDSDEYKTGQYYISIDETWQIHLNFGQLPKSYRDFQEEVKVFTRHEVEHYMCCPFNVLTHSRMLEVIIDTIDTYNKHYKRHKDKDKITKLAASLANQVEDIIVDTKNFQRYREETLKSEINWIKKGTNFRDIPRHSRLMSLTKEAIWQENLDLNETDEYVLKEVKSLSEKFLEGGIDNKKLFLEKAEAYTHSFFKLFEQDKKEQQQQEQGQSGQNSQGNTTGQSGNQQQFGQGSSGQPQIIPAKDSLQFVFQSPDKIQETLQELAQETSIEQFNQILQAAGFNSLTDTEKEKIWFEAQSVAMLPIIENAPTGSKDNYSYPATWKLGDDIGDIDMMLTFSNSPIFIPGVTTKKWEKNSVFALGSEKKQRDLLLVVDTSGSMGKVIDVKSNMHQAILAAYGIIRYYESTEFQMACIGFSNYVSFNVEWTKKYDEIKESLLRNGSDGTSFPVSAIKSAIEKNKNSIVTVVITDGEFDNIKNSLNYFREYLNEGNKLYILLQNRSAEVLRYQALSDYGAKIVVALTAAEMTDIVLNDVS